MSKGLPCWKLAILAWGALNRVNDVFYHHLVRGNVAFLFVSPVSCNDSPCFAGFGLLVCVQNRKRKKEKSVLCPRGDGWLRLNRCLLLPWVWCVVVTDLHYSSPLAAAVMWVFITWVVMLWIAAGKVCVTGMLIALRSFSKWQIRSGLKYGMSGEQLNHLEMLLSWAASGLAFLVALSLILCLIGLCHILAWILRLSIPP